MQGKCFTRGSQPGQISESYDWVVSQLPVLYIYFLLAYQYVWYILTTITPNIHLLVMCAARTVSDFTQQPTS